LIIYFGIGVSFSSSDLLKAGRQGLYGGLGRDWICLGDRPSTPLHGDDGCNEHHITSFHWQHHVESRDNGVAHTYARAGAATQTSQSMGGLEQENTGTSTCCARSLPQPGAFADHTFSQVDLFSFYIYMRDVQRSVDYLDFW
jgi:hypothetical protein